MGCALINAPRHRKLLAQPKIGSHRVALRSPGEGEPGQLQLMCRLNGPATRLGPGQEQGLGEVPPASNGQKREARMGLKKCCGRMCCCVGSLPGMVGE